MDVCAPSVERRITAASLTSKMQQSDLQWHHKLCLEVFALARIVRLPFRVTSTCMLVIAALLLLLSWFGLSGAGEMLSWSLAPYDSTPLELRPPIGTWPRDVNDFFQYAVGSKTLTAILVGLSLALFLFALRKMSHSPGDWGRLMLGFALVNFALVAAMLASAFVMGSLLLEMAPKAGYGWMIRFLIPEIFLLGLWILLQARVIPRWARLRS